ncbi:MAG: hypothetical protein V1835_00225 [Candidatus Micrarchaeota archaeon]
MSWLSYLFYGYFVAGSVTLGYLLLRLTYPELRTIDVNMKLGLSFVAGVLLTLAAFAVDYLYDGKLEVLQGNGTYAIILFLLFLLAFVFLKFYFIFSKPDFLTVGVPIQNPINIRIEKTESKEEEQQREVFEKIIGKRQGADMKDRSLEKKKDLIQKLRKTEMQAVSDERVELHKKENVLSKIMGMFSSKPPRQVGLEEMKRTKVVLVPDKPQPSIQKPSVQQIAQTQRTIQASAIAQTQQAIPMPSAQTQGAPKPPEPRKGFMSMISGIIGEPQKQGQKPAAAQPTPAPMQATATSDQNIQASKTTQPGGALPTTQSEQPMPAIQTIKKPLVASHPKTIPEKTQEPQAAIKTDQPLSQAPQLPIPQTQPASGKPVSSAQTPPEPNPPSQKFRQVIEQEKFIGLKSEVMSGEPIEVPEKPKQTQEELSRFQSDPKTVEEERRKAAQLQEELILRDILPKDVASQQALAAKQAQPVQIRPGQHRIYQAVQQANQEVIVHRRYMLRGQEPLDAPKGMSVIGNQDVMQADNFDMLVNDVYTQLKENKKEGVRANLAVAPPKETLQQAALQKNALTFDDLLGESPSGKKEETGGGVMSQLASLNEASGKKPEPQKSDIAFVKIEAEKGMGCPTCHTKNSKIIFCPYCGSGMCANCSPSIKIVEGAFIYTCPKCKEDVDVRKKAVQPAA